uniref:Uncharacterized protein n=1 Tax=Ombrophytum subterraneum TaxID=50155 RepID=A0A6M8PH09_9MAGN|nr:hypothetical protein [Ombrophytum subterraneum]
MNSAVNLRWFWLRKRLFGFRNKEASGSLFLSNGEEDRNTKYFHTKTVIRRKALKIEALKDHEGNWVYDDDELKSMAVSYFQNLYLSEGITSRPELPVMGHGLGS